MSGDLKNRLAPLAKTAVVAVLAGWGFGHEANAALTDGLKACWHFNSSDTLMNDVGPHRTSLESIGSVTFDANESPYGNGSAYFNGSSYLQPLGGGYLPDGPHGSSPFTFACWFKVSATGARQLFVFGRDIDSHAVGLRMESGQDVCLSYLWGTVNESLVYPTDGTSTFAGGWHSVVHVWDGTTFKIFIDGVNAALTPKAASVTRTAATPPDIIPYVFRLGWSLNSGKWSGWIDEAALWDRALTTDEIASYISGGVPATTSTFPGSDYMITSASDAIPALSGSDRLTVNLPVGTSLRLEGDHSGWHGVLDVLQGVVVIPSATAVGSAVIYCTNETFAAANANNARIEIAGSMTLANEIHLGTETPLNVGARLIVTSGNAVLSGQVFINNTRLHVTSPATLTLAGDVSSSGGYHLCLYNSNARTSTGDTGFFVSGRFTYLDTLFVEGEYTRALITSPGQYIVHPLPTRYGTIACGVDNVFLSATANGRNASWAERAHLDLAGTSQSFGNIDELANDAGLNVRNSSAEVKGKFTVTQTKENGKSNLTVVGPLDFVKRGSEMLVLANRFSISGTLDVAEGVLKLTGPQTVIADRVLVREGAILDLGGRSYACGGLTLSGGVVRNGTLLGETNIVMSGSVGATLAGGVTVKEGSGTASLDGGVTLGHTMLTNGLVACWHFDSSETLLEDSGPYGYTLANCWTNSQYKVSATKGPVTFDANEGRYGSGSAYFSEHVFLSYPGGYPEKAPCHGEPFTLAFWFRLRNGVTGNRGLCFLGQAGNGTGLGMVMWNSTANIMNYLWNGANEILVSPTDGSDNFCDGDWHSVVQVWDGSHFRIYVDGVESALTPRTATVTRTSGTPVCLRPSYFYIGTGYNNMYLSGWMDEVALWDRALAPADIAEYIAGGVPTGQEPRQTPAAIRVDAGSMKVSGTAFASGITNGVVLSYRFDTPATLYQDSGPYGYTLTEGTKNTKFRTGGTRVTCATAEGEWAHGGGAAYFDGTNNLVLANGTNDGVAQPAMIPTGANPFTLGFFFRRATKYPANVNDGADYMNDGLIFYGNTSQAMGMNGYAFWNWQSRLWNYPNTTAYEYLLPAEADYVNRKFRTGWHSLVQTWNGTVMRYWVDGKEVTNPQLKNPTNSPRTLNTPPNIGSKWFYISGAFNNSFFKGWMDDITIWSRALTEDEALAFSRYGLDFAENAAVVDGEAGALTLTAGTSASVRVVNGVETVCRDKNMTIIILR